MNQVIPHVPLDDSEEEIRADSPPLTFENFVVAVARGSVEKLLSITIDSLSLLDGYDGRELDDALMRGVQSCLDRQDIRGTQEIIAFRPTVDHSAQIQMAYIGALDESRFDHAEAIARAFPNEVTLEFIQHLEQRRFSRTVFDWVD